MRLLEAQTLTLSYPGLKLLGFKDKGELAFEDNIKHSIFIYPDERVSGVTRYRLYVTSHGRPGVLGEHTNV